MRKSSDTAVFLDYRRGPQTPLYKNVLNARGEYVYKFSGIHYSLRPSRGYEIYSSNKSYVNKI